jgi:O-antigen/teichoic acid export membrane protein
MSSLAKEFRYFPILSVPARLAFVGANQVPVLAIGIKYAPEVVGLFAMATRLAAAPLRAVSQAISEAILRRSIEKRHDSTRVAPVIVAAAKVLLISGTPTFAFLFVYGGGLLTWVLGER